MNPDTLRAGLRVAMRTQRSLTRTDREALEAVVPEPLEIADNVVSYEFIRMPDSTGFGDYTESGQVIPVRLAGESGGYVHAMFLDFVRSGPV